jgi:hypothetical protein
MLVTCGIVTTGRATAGYAGEVLDHVAVRLGHCYGICYDGRISHHLRASEFAIVTELELGDRLITYRAVGFF